MNTRLIIRSLLALLLVVLLWLAWWVFGRSPEAQVRAAQAWTLIEAVEERDWDALEKLIAPNYTDAYGHNRESALKDGRKYLSGFFTLTSEDRSNHDPCRERAGHGDHDDPPRGAMAWATARWSWAMSTSSPSRGSSTGAIPDAGLGTGR
jgi:hypothetical protein